MKTTVHEIADRIYRFSTCVPEAAPGGFTFNQFLIDADEPLLFHTGPRRMFPLVSQAIARILPLDRLRWIAFGHVESDECGAMNEFLAAAPRAAGRARRARLHGLARRPVRPAAAQAGGRRGHRPRRQARAPHRHAARAAQLGGARALRGDAPARCSAAISSRTTGDGPALTDGDIVGPALEAEELFHATALSPATGDDDPPARRARAADAGADARLVDADPLRASLCAQLADAYDSMINKT